jgi:hypothetical protein
MLLPFKNRTTTDSTNNNEPARGEQTMNRQTLSAQNFIAHFGFVLFLAVTVIASFMMTGCSDSGPLAPETTSTTNSATDVQEGTVLVMSTYQTDSTGHTWHVGNDTVVVGRLHASMEGRENVRELRSANGSSYFHYASNGDLMSLESSGNWSTLPFSGENMPAPQRSEERGGNQKRVLITEQKHIGEKSITVGAATYRAVGIEIVMTQEMYISGTVKDGGFRLTDRRRVVTEIWFAPALGFFSGINATATILDSQGKVLSAAGKIETRLTEVRVR